MTAARAARLVALPVLTCVALVVGVTSGWGAAPDTAYDVFRVDHPEPEAKSTWGTRAIAANDLTGDGVADIFVDLLGQPGRVRRADPRSRGVSQERG